MDPTYPLVPIANFISFFLVVLALLVTAGRPWNIGVCMFAIWTALSCAITAVNTIVWKDNFDIVAPVWCDITSHFVVGFNVAIPACSLVITRRISQITRLRSLVENRQRRREDVLDLVICIGIPILLMADYYVVQGSRFQVLEEFGCASAPIGSGVEILLQQVWYVGMPLISIVLYLPKIIWHFYHQRREMNEFLSSSGSMSHNTYLRILALGCLDVFVTLPIGVLGLAVDIKENRIVFYQGWTAIHSFWEPQQVTKEMWTVTPFGTFDVKWNEWISVFFALVFFVLFGLTSEAREKYRRALRFVLRPVGLKHVSTDTVLSDVVFDTQHVGNDAISVSFGASTRVSSSDDVELAAPADLEEGKEKPSATSYGKDY